MMEDLLLGWNMLYWQKYLQAGSVDCNCTISSETQRMFNYKITIILLYFCEGIAKLHTSTDCIRNKFVRYKHKGQRCLHVCDWWLRTIFGTQCVQRFYDYLRAKCHKPNCNVSLNSAVKGAAKQIFVVHNLITSYCIRIQSKQKQHVSAGSIIYHTQFHKPQIKCRSSRSCLASSPVSHISNINMADGRTSHN